MDVVRGSDEVLTAAVCGPPGVYRAGLLAVLRAAPGLAVVGELDSAGYSPRLLPEHRPHVLLLDLAGFEPGDPLARRAVGGTAASAVDVIALFSGCDPGSALELLRDGAKGLLHRDTPVPRLVEAIRAVGRGGVALDPQVARELVAALRTDVLPGPPAARVDRLKLTPRQRQILGLVGLGLANAEIADQLRLGRPTVKTHVSSLLRVLDLRDRTQLAVFACTRGIAGPDGGTERSA
jgi:DNA-binding NarL/FixJ family response regulator